MTLFLGRRKSGVPIFVLPMLDGVYYYSFFPPMSTGKLHHPGHFQRQNGSMCWLLTQTSPDGRVQWECNSDYKEWPDYEYHQDSNWELHRLRIISKVVYEWSGYLPTQSLLHNRSGGLQVLVPGSELC